MLLFEEIAIPSEETAPWAKDASTLSKEAAIQPDLEPRRPDAGTRAALLGLSGRAASAHEAGTGTEGKARGDLSRVGRVGEAEGCLVPAQAGRSARGTPEGSVGSPSRSRPAASAHRGAGEPSEVVEVMHLRRGHQYRQASQQVQRRLAAGHRPLEPHDQLAALLRGPREPLLRQRRPQAVLEQRLQAPAVVLVQVPARLQREPVPPSGELHRALLARLGKDGIRALPAPGAHPIEGIGLRLLVSELPAQHRPGPSGDSLDGPLHLLPRRFRKTPARQLAPLVLDEDRVRHQAVEVGVAVEPGSEALGDADG